jgi:hypothetical protein
MGLCVGGDVLGAGVGGGSRGRCDVVAGHSEIRGTQ